MESRTRNVSRNLIFGTANRVFNLILPFVTRTMLLYLLGTTSLGVSSLFSSILSFLSLAELGFGSAITYAMYKPIAKKDLEAVSALLNYYRRLYRYIGLAILLIGLGLIPYLKYLIKGETPDGVNLYVLFCLYLLNSVSSYFFAGYRESLLIAYQRIDIRDKIAMVITACVRFTEITVIYFTRNLYAYVAVTIWGTLLTNIYTAIVTRKMFPNIVCKGEVSPQIKDDIKKRLGGLFGTKLNSIVVHQADTVIISAFLGLTLLTQYGNYYYIMNVVSGFVMMLFSSMTASVGNKIASDPLNEVFQLFRRINFANSWVVGWWSICLVCLYHPFMILWVKEELTLPPLMSVLMALYFYVYQIQRTLLTFKDAGGLWYEDRFRPYCSMILNVVSNLIFVQIIGIYGIVLSSIVAFVVSIPWCNHVIFLKMFHCSPSKNLLNMLRNFIFTVTIALITYFVCSLCPGTVLGFVGRIFICIIVPNFCFFVVFRKEEELSYILRIARQVLRGKIR